MIRTVRPCTVLIAKLSFRQLTTLKQTAVLGSKPKLGVLLRGDILAAQ
ncbi:MAG: hypothetical protein P1P65_05985 [Treponema sp.]